jgi:hypothetical protein
MFLLYLASSHVYLIQDKPFQEFKENVEYGRDYGSAWIGGTFPSFFSFFLPMSPYVFSSSLLSFLPFIQLRKKNHTINKKVSRSTRLGLLSFFKSKFHPYTILIPDNKIPTQCESAQRKSKRGQD